MLFTETATRRSLKQLDHAVAIEEKRLPAFRRFCRRYLSGRSFLAGQLLWEPYGMFKAFAISYAVAGKALLTGLAVKFPFLVAGWEWLQAAVEGLFVVGSASS